MKGTVRRGFINNVVRVVVKKLDINKKSVLREERNNSKLQSMDNLFMGTTGKYDRWRVYILAYKKADFKGTSRAQTVSHFRFLPPLTP